MNSKVASDRTCKSWDLTGRPQWEVMFRQLSSPENRTSLEAALSCLGLRSHKGALVHPRRCRVRAKGISFGNRKESKRWTLSVPPSQALKGQMVLEVNLIIKVAGQTLFLTR